MFAEAMSGLGAFKAMMDMAKGLKDINDATVRNTAVIELTEKIMSAQSAQAALIGEIGKLEKDLVRFETWEAEKQRYELHKLHPGILIYRLKTGMENGEPPHEICANCYNNGVKLLLHNTGVHNGRTHWKCHTCGFDEQTGDFTPPSRGVHGDGPWR
ncbi:hypothetical protein LB566_10815 [Mesorhizobium sp. CA13]|uniref:hypothetical protein n=1 Tax=Mesorhizobium sp. CA13 TaxID=2876643 RepID=UPI001CD0148C|nr:hypothetical protein [Mesorhizobium sp. CA13]MBZ9854297.1 hypothetical protein [Mesorhizobium sp. CA13]